MPRFDIRDIPPAGWFGAGLLLFWSSFAWSWMAGGSAGWSDSLATQLQQASQNYHDAIHAHSHAERDVANSAGLDQARRSYQELHARLDEARSGAGPVATTLRAAGVLLLVAGAVRVLWHHLAT